MASKGVITMKKEIKFKEFYKKRPYIFYGLVFALLGFILHDKTMISFAIGIFIGATLYEEKEK